MSRVRTYSAAPAVRARSRSLEDLARTAPVPGRAVWRRTERDLQVVEEESVVFSNIEVRVKRAGPFFFFYESLCCKYSKDTQNSRVIANINVFQLH